MRRFSVLALRALLFCLGTVPPMVVPGVLVAGGVVAAGTALRLDLSGLVEGADLVLEGRVIAQRGVLGPARRIDTEYTIAVDHTFLGEPLPVRVIRLPGGVLPDGRGMILPGLPRLSIGGSMLLFLTAADAIGMRMPVGLAQGELPIVTGASGEKRIVREQADLSLLDAGTGAVTQADARAFLDYAATVAEIEARVAAKRARPSHRPATGPVPAGKDDLKPGTAPGNNGAANTSQERR